MSSGSPSGKPGIRFLLRRNKPLAGIIRSDLRGGGGVWESEGALPYADARPPMAIAFAVDHRNAFLISEPLTPEMTLRPTPPTPRIATVSLAVLRLC